MLDDALAASHSLGKPAGANFLTFSMSDDPLL
jgi:hypothetical protein